MTSEGYIPISRRLFEHAFWNEAREFSKAEAWIDLIQSCQYKDGGGVLVKGKYINLDRGQTQGSLRYFMNRWRWGSADKVKRFFCLLEEQDMIRVEDKSVTRRITLCKYDSYNTSHDRDTTETRQRHDRDTTETRQIQERKKEIKEKKKEERAPRNFENFDLIKRVGKDAARIWTETGAAEVLNGKGEMVLEWLQYRCEIGRPVRAHMEFSEIVKGFKKYPAERLREMMAYSIAAQYPALYPDFDKKKTGGGQDGATQYPDDWAPGIEERNRYTPQQTIEYHKHLISRGWRKETHQGKTYWKK